MRDYLWAGSMTRKRSKVSLAQVCKPKIEGRLGMRRALECNKAAIMRLIWDILVNKQSLWVNWCKAEVLKGQSFWQMEHKQTLSVTWKYLLKLRPAVSANLVYTIGINSTWSIWYDPWYQGISLCERVGNSAIYDSSLPPNASLSEILLDTNWNWPSHVWQLREISSACTNIPITQRDSIGWRSAVGIFTHKSAWESLRLSAPTVPWAKVVWFKGAIPKHSFCLWITFRKAHLTLDKLQGFGVVQQSLCPFGCGQQQRLDHVDDLVSILVLMITYLHLTSLLNVQVIRKLHKRQKTAARKRHRSLLQKTSTS
ncbi:zf-RVT domain-containing protein [Cephalotus follicularis]|uniref:Zf-RVT domain-containing protein n=1 Tax=Cephalotus follicularis TaxID=3775 RepID=A0A1Q3CJK1_CEPFO|nr:zf-RVT domain-containing protein [Cephalotus follicularis]